jgi:Na+/H+ antiporter NhaC
VQPGDFRRLRVLRIKGILKVVDVSPYPLSPCPKASGSTGSLSVLAFLLSMLIAALTGTWLPG